METIVFSDGIFEFVSEEKDYVIDGIKKHIKRKYVRRPPGVRAIIINEQGKILLSKEYRYELNSFDYRLPGGKVFDSIEDYKNALKKDNIIKYANAAVIKEVKEEVGISVQDAELYTISQAGASVVWDLYYFIIKKFTVIPNAQELEENEVIDGFVWKDEKEVIKMCLDKTIHEDRTVGVLLTYLMRD